jgi:hypothetical protein
VLPERLATAEEKAEKTLRESLKKAASAASLQRSKYSDDEDDEVSAVEKKEEAVPSALAAAAPSAAISSTKQILKRKLAIDSELEDSLDAAQYLDPETPFSAQGIIHNVPWTSKCENPAPLKLLLPGFSYRDNQTVALKLDVPNNAKGWSLNICPAQDYYNTNILLHFNPRLKKETLVLTDKPGTWSGNSITKSLAGLTSKNEGLKSKLIDLVIQVREDGFVVFANDMYNSFFPHRRDPLTTSTGGNGAGGLVDLKLIVNAKDANGFPLDVAVEQVLHKTSI